MSPVREATVRGVRGRSALLALVAAFAILVPASATVAAPKFPTTTIQILDVSDWHAQIDPLSINRQSVGGAAALATLFDQHRAANPNTLTVTAGDDFGASPPLSDFFDETPSILAQRMMGIQVGTFGNHNFDRGVDFLQDKIDQADSDALPGTPYRYVSANLANRDDNLSGVEDYQIFEIDGVRIAVIGITNPEAPTLVFPGNFGTIEPTDPVAAAMAAQAAARKDGAQVFVVITHMGITNQATGTGPLTDFAAQVEGFDLIVGDHTNFQFERSINGALVIENASKGATYSVTELEIEKRGSKERAKVVGVTNTFHTPFATGVTPDPEVVSVLQPYRDEIAPLLAEVLGTSTVAIPRSDNCGNSEGRLCESLVGNVVADSMRLRYDTDFAFTNAGGLRAALTCPDPDLPNDSCDSFTPPPYPITRGNSLTVLPFGNIVVTATMTGAELKATLERSVEALPSINGRFAQVSGLCFTYDISAAVGSRVSGAVYQAADGGCTGGPVDLSAGVSYSVATNDFVASGGDGYPNIISTAVSREIMEQVLADYVKANTPLSPSIQGRIVCTSSGAVACPAVVP